VLHDLSFTIKKGERVGLVGATGCGKSTLASSFFRFVEASSGSIHIDGIDISKIGLLDLRSRLTIVPQDPGESSLCFSSYYSVAYYSLFLIVILSGTLRSTLDIFGEHEDSEIYAALRRVHLIKESERPDEQEAGANRSVFWNLDAEVAEGVRQYPSRATTTVADLFSLAGIKFFNWTETAGVHGSSAITILSNPLARRGDRVD